MGILDSAKQKSAIRIDHYHSGNLLYGTHASDYDIRDTTTRSFTLDLSRMRAEDPGGGAIDMGILINSSLTASAASVDALVVFKEAVDLSAVGGSVTSAGITLFSTEEAVNDLPNNGRFRWLPENTPGLTETSIQRTFAIPELRGPVDAVIILITARTAPDAGSVNLRAIRRY